MILSLHHGLSHVAVINRMNKYKVAVAQIHTDEDKASNLAKMEKMIDRASESGAKLICFSEMINIQSPNLKPYEMSESIGGETISFLSGLAAKYNIWICCGSIFESIPGKQKAYNTSVLLSDEGEIKAVYRKRHTFDITLPDGRATNESDTIEPGDEIVSVDTVLGHIGLAICYDLRFPEQFREMTGKGMQVLLLPASFVAQTGKYHWEPLLRARAIENGCYVLASNQYGSVGKHDAYGHSMIINPWGEILAQADEDEELLFAEIDIDNVDTVRRQIPSTVGR